MRITWKDGVSTLALVGAIALERAHSNNWGWPLMDDARWVIGAITLLTFAIYIFSYTFDTVRGPAWSIIANVLGAIALVVAIIGLAIGTSDFVVLLMAGAIALWLASIVRHLTIHTPLTHGHI